MFAYVAFFFCSKEACAHAYGTKALQVAITEKGSAVWVLVFADSVQNAILSIVPQNGATRSTPKEQLLRSQIVRPCRWGTCPPSHRGVQAVMLSYSVFGVLLDVVFIRARTRCVMSAI